MSSWLETKIVLGFLVDPSEWPGSEQIEALEMYPIEYSFSGLPDDATYWIVYARNNLGFGNELKSISWQDLKDNFCPDDIIVEINTKMLNEVREKLGLSNRSIGPILFSNYG
jgi:hypothetical protein